MKNILFFLVILMITVSCTKHDDILHGAGATFPLPLYEVAFAEFQKTTGQKVVYEGIGSGAGIYKLKDRKTDFCATDILIDPQHWDEEVVYIPTCIGAVAITYNLPAKPVLNLSSELLANIFLGEITNWTDQRITKLNPDIILPNQRILVINRSDESGTSQIFYDYLSKVSEKWNVRKPNPLKEIFAFYAKNNEDMANLVSDMFGSIGFISLSYAMENNLAYGKIQNSSGNFVLPSMESTRAAAETVLLESIKIYITNTDVEFGYPISSFTWLAVYRDLKYLGSKKAGEIISLLNWMITDGQRYADPLNYAQLPAQSAAAAQKLIRTIKY
ncbi:MAG: phosphate ABC transporter substrate-binding protein PstS [Candidatus Cloacimonadales bacterium]|nr:phosphate ABC transporter substrate-binding protein PstS [Candidatus Cloacimonadales bacterium]